MNIIACTEQEFAQLKQQLDEISRNLQDLNPSDQFWDNADVIKNLKVSERTLSTWREKAIIRYSKIGSKIYYRREDITQFLEDHVEEVRLKKA